jgi:hypothetical protein
MAPSSLSNSSMESSVSPFNDPAGPSSPLDQDSTLIAVTEMGQSRGLVGGLVSGLAREPQKTPTPDAPALFGVTP